MAGRLQLSVKARLNKSTVTVAVTLQVGGSKNLNKFKVRARVDQVFEVVHAAVGTHQGTLSQPSQEGHALVVSSGLANIYQARGRRMG